MHRSRDDNVHEILGAIGYVGPKWGAQKCPRRQLRNGRFSPNLATTRESRLKRRFWTEIYENFPFRGHLPLKPQTWRGSNRHPTQNKLQVKGCTAERYCLLHVVVQRSGSFEVGQRFCMTYGCRATGRQNCPIFLFWPISQYKTPKKYLTVNSLQPRDYIAE